MLRLALIVLTLALAWLFWIRPILRLNPKFTELLDRHDSFMAALRAKLAGIKQKLTTALTVVAGGVLSLHDFVVPLAQSAGVDAKAILPMIPATVWPLITLSLLILVQWFRNLSDRRGAGE